MLNRWFPTIIDIESLDPPAKVHREMVRYVDRFYEKNKQHYTCCLTGDIGDVHTHNLHDQSTFSWLNKQVFIQAQKYLEGLGADINNINIYATKAWPVVIKKGGQVNRHKHQNSVLSVVYYLQSNDESGKIEFRCSHTPIEHLPLRYKEGNGSNYTSGDYFPTPYKMIIFPSSLQHRVKPYTGDENRYSISYDIIVASKPKVPLEFTIPDPSEWRVLNSS